MRWVRTSVSIGEDPSILALAEELRIKRTEAVGLCILVFAKLPEHARDGNLEGIADSVLELWSGWSGKRGAFAAAFLSHLCTPQRVVAGWEKHNGAAIRKADTEAERKRTWREKQAMSRGQSADARPDGTPDVRGTGRDETNNLTTLSSTQNSPSSPHCANVENLPADASSTSPADLVTAIPTAYLPALETLGALARHPAAFYAELRMILNGAHGPRGRPVPGAVLGRALHEMAANSQPFNVVLFRGYIRRMGEQPDAPSALEAEIGRSLTSGERNFITGLRALDPSAS